MNAPDCETALMAKMAEADGEISRASGEEADLHISRCESCRKELEGLLGLSVRLNRRNRQEYESDLWPHIAKRIGPCDERRSGAWPFALTVVLLVAYKVVEMVPERDPGVPLRIVPIAILIALFVLIKENPFRINADLAMEE